MSVIDEQDEPASAENLNDLTLDFVASLYAKHPIPDFSPIRMLLAVVKEVASNDVEKWRHIIDQKTNSTVHFTFITDCLY